MKLYYTPGACSINPHITLRELGLPFDLVKVDLRAKTYEGGGNYLDVNPKGYVPALVLDDGQVLTENAIMVQYLADLVASPKLAPEAGSMDRVRAAELLVFIATELHKGMGPFYNPKASDELKAALKERLLLRWAYLEKALGTKPYLLGDEFSIVDSYAFYVLRAWQHTLGVALPSPTLTAYYQRLASRPSVQKALEAEGLTA